MEVSVLLNIFISVFSGVLTAGLLFAIGQYFNRIFIPWYRGIKYKGLDISGEWLESHNYEGAFLQDSVITIKQTAEQIEGEIILVKKNSETKKEFAVKKFKFKGDFYNNFLNITCWNSDQKQIGTHNYLMTLKMDGRGMEGIKTFYDVGFHKIKTSQIYWLRKDKFEV